MTRQGRSIVALIAVVGLASCARERDITGNPIDGSHRVTTFAVIDARHETLWKLSAPSPGVQAVGHLEYGQVPAGFRQETPEGDAKPRPMISGENVVVVIITPEFVYRGDGEAKGPKDFGSESWESAPPDALTIDRALRGERIGRHEQ